MVQRFPLIPCAEGNPGIRKVHHIEVWTKWPLICRQHFVIHIKLVNRAKCRHVSTKPMLTHKFACREDLIKLLSTATCYDKALLMRYPQTILLVDKLISNQKFEFQSKFHRSLFLRVQSTISQHWFRCWTGNMQDSYPACCLQVEFISLGLKHICGPFY